MDDLRRRGPALSAEPAVAEPEIERRSGHDHQVGLAERDRARPGHQQRMPGREDAAALAVGDHRQLQLLGRRPGGQLSAVQPDVRAKDEDRPAGGAEEPGDAADRRRVRLVRGRRASRSSGVWGRGRTGAGPCGAGPGAGPAFGGAEQRLQTRVQEHGPAVPGAGQAEGLGYGRTDGGRLVHGPGALGDRGQQRRVVQFLQPARAPAAVRGPAGQHNEGRSVEMGGCHRTDPVGDARAGSQHGQARLPRQARGCLGGEHGRLLVPDIDDRHWRIGSHSAVVEREDVPARQREHGLDAMLARRRHCPGAAMPGLLIRAHGGDVTSR